MWLALGTKWGISSFWRSQVVTWCKHINCKKVQMQQYDTTAFGMTSERQNSHTFLFLPIFCYSFYYPIKEKDGTNVYFAVSGLHKRRWFLTTRLLTTQTSFSYWFHKTSNISFPTVFSLYFEEIGGTEEWVIKIPDVKKHSLQYVRIHVSLHLGNYKLLLFHVPVGKLSYSVSQESQSWMATWKNLTSSYPYCHTSRRFVCGRWLYLWL